MKVTDQSLSMITLMSIFNATRLFGKTVLVTGARAVESVQCISFVFIFSIFEYGLQQGRKFTSIQLDVSDNQQIASLWTKVPQDLRDVDILGKFIT
jgi:3-hydroxy acid dehydrogenase / malonic semialdehyde reductase